MILNVGAIQKRKNIARLVEAFETVDPAWRLVLAGSAGYGAEEILARIEASPARERILCRAMSRRRNWPAGTRAPSIFAFPSLDEGFGMPVLEAMAAGVPVRHLEPLGAARGGRRRGAPGRSGGHGSARHRRSGN